jgi:hypothetical protein
LSSCSLTPAARLAKIAHLFPCSSCIRLAVNPPPVLNDSCSGR